MSETTEYQKVAALLAMDIDTMLLTAEANPQIALGLFKKLKERKDLIINDKQVRDTRYYATARVFNLSCAPNNILTGINIPCKFLI